MQNQAKEIKEFILQTAPKHPSDLVAKTAEHFNVTPTTVHRHINRLIKEGKLIKSGNTRAIVYHVASSYFKIKQYTMTGTLSEDKIFYEDFSEIFSNLPPNIYKVCSFGVTEMINNAIDHSQGTKLQISTNFDNPFLIIKVRDNGIGVLKKICNFLNCDDLREGIIHLTKGKITTDPTNHTGQGIFFTSRMFNIFQIQANGYLYTKDNIQEDWTFARSEPSDGTEITMIININSGINIKHIFNQYQNDDFGFDKTEIVVQLAKFDEEFFVSRSQAKRIILGLEKFDNIVLDFKGIDFIGQGFVDEIFRVFQNKYPKIKITYINANQDVEFMIKRGLV